MPTNTTKKTSTKKEKLITSTKNKSSVTKPTTNKTGTNKKDGVKKVVVKRRKRELIPTRASAVAIASQANRAQKEALIKKLASEKNVSMEKRRSSNMIPLWVWIFFWCALLMFCVSFYQAIIRPQLEKELSEANSYGNMYEMHSENSVSLWWSSENQQTIESSNNYDNIVTEEYLPTVPTWAVDTIEEFFKRLSAKQFDSAYDLFTPSLQRSSEIREHFTSFRMNPFVSWIEWELKPTNFQYVSTSTYWKDRYSFDLSYTLAGSQETFDEDWEFVIDTSWDEPKITSIICTTTKCSRHPIFWPESFGLMR